MSFNREIEQNLAGIVQDIFKHYPTLLDTIIALACRCEDANDWWNSHAAVMNLVLVELRQSTQDEKDLEENLIPTAFKYWETVYNVMGGHINMIPREKRIELFLNKYPYAALNRTMSFSELLPRS